MLSKSILLLLLCAFFAISGAVSHADHQHQHPPLPVNIDWLTENQHTQLDTADPDILAQVTKLRHFYDQLEDASPGKIAAAKKIVHQCYNWLTTVTTKEERNELKQLHHTDHNSCKEKVNEYIGRLPETEQTQMRKYWHFCEHVWYDSHVDHAEDDQHHSVAHHLTEDQVSTTRLRRSHDQHTHECHTLEDYFKTHLTWLTDEQKETLRTLKAEGKGRTEIQQKVLEFYQTTTGEVREQASELLKGGCRELLAMVVGPEKAAEVKTLKETGASMTELQTKVDQLFAEVTDDHKKTMIKEYGPGCKTIFGVGGENAPAIRRRRDHTHGDHTHGEHTLEDYFKTHLTWLTDEQKETLRTMKAEGKGRTEIQQKVLEFYQTTTGEVREQASELLKGGCRELLAMVVGPEKAAEIKTLKETGVSLTELQTKVDQFLSEVTDEHKKGLAKEYGPSCKTIFGVGSESAPAVATRRRRAVHRNWDDDENNVNTQQEDQYRNQQQPQPRERGSDFDLADHHSSWLSDDQKDQLRQQKENGEDGPSIHNKVLEFFHVSPDDVKEMARNLLTSGCEKLLGKTFGEEKAEELQRIRTNEGAEQMQQRVQEYAGELEDEGQRAEALRFGSTCRKIFELLVRRRRSIGRWEREMMDE